MRQMRVFLLIALFFSSFVFSKFGDGVSRELHENTHPCYGEQNASDLRGPTTSVELPKLVNIVTYSLDDELVTNSELQTIPDFNMIDIVLGDMKIAIWARGYDPIILDTETYNVVPVDMEIDAHSLFGIAYSQSAVLLGFANQGNEFNVWQLDTGNSEFTIPLARNEVGANIYFLPNNRCAVVTTSYSHIRFFDFETSSEIGSIETESFVSDIGFSVDGRYLSYATFGDNDSSGDIVISAWDLATNKQVFLQNLESVVTDLALHPQGEIIAVIVDGELSAYSVNAPFEVININTVSELTRIEFSPDGHIVGGDVEGNIHFWNVQTGDELFSTNIGQASIVNILFDRNDHTLITLLLDGTLGLWEYH